MDITRQTAKRILKASGATRVSDSAAAELAEAINKFAYSIADKAVKLASHAKRTTVRREDIELAA
ncbi:MAG: NFYB/HAP3 family transcription factor subunit [Candidatus Micrarchaeota archaeon]|nr:NFYB/HAP3 family transcription factor subunit [Candidatus Micrarchaeota archaeon]MDE1834692.1 NFYB/HAP3 family transcription factor subunit [Candidatus Micrarchaeota archaeon]